MPANDLPNLDQMRLALLNQIPAEPAGSWQSDWDVNRVGEVQGLKPQKPIGSIFDNPNIRMDPPPVDYAENQRARNTSISPNSVMFKFARDADRANRMIDAQQRAQQKIQQANTPPPPPERPLDGVMATFADLALQYNPATLLRKQAAAVAPITEPIATVATGIPAMLASAYAGEDPDLQAAMTYQPRSKGGQENLETLGEVFDAAKIPHMWPMSPRGGARPMLSPNDVRVMGAQVAETGRNIAAIPADIRNAQQGITRLTPSGRAPIGETIFNAAERGAAPFEGMLTPKSDMSGMFPSQAGVIRPFGSTVSQPNVPPSARKGTEYLKFKGNEIDRVITNNLPEKGAPLTPDVALGQYDFAINANESPDLHTAYNKYINEKLKDMYPSLNSGDRFEALRVLYPDHEDRAQVMLGMINGFLETPQAKELALRELGHEVPASDELQRRHDAAVNWLTTRLNDYVSKYIGTAQDPGLSLAAKGMTVLTPDELRESAGNSTYGAQGRRTAAGYPAEGAFAKPLEDKNTEIDKQIAIVNDLNSRRAQEERNARDLGILREQHPPWVAVANQAAKGQNQLNTLKTQRGLLEQATNYESLADMAIRGGGVGTEVPPAQRQFWPGSQPTREYIASAEQLSNLGIPEIARKFYDDVMTGKLPVDSIQGLTAPKYIEKLGKAQLATTTNKARLAEEYRRDITREALATIPPNAPVFGNTKVVELTSATPKADALREASLATAVLDVCIGEGGRASGNKKHFLTGRDQTWESVLLPNGQPNPKASNKESSYINDVYDNGHTHSVFRDAETGFPVAVFQFKPTDATGTMYNIGFTSGWHNRNIDPKYFDDVRDYLNSRADNIKSISDNTEQNANLTDLNDRRGKQNLSSALGHDSRYLDKYDLSGLPRFVLPKDVRTYIEQVNAANPAVSQAVALTDQRPSDSLPAYVTSSMAAVFADVNESQRTAHDDAGESNRIGVSESYFTNMRDSFDELLRAHTPADALTILVQRLDIDENRLANSNRASNNIIADGIVDLHHAASSLLEDGIPRYVAARNVPAPAPVTAIAQIRAVPGNARAEHIANMFAEFGGALVLRTVDDHRRVAALLRHPRTGADTAQNYIEIGDSLGDVTVRASDFYRSNLTAIANELDRRAAAMQPAVAEQLDPATDGEIGATRDAIVGTFVFPEASPAVQAALRRIGDTIADMAIPGSETVAQYLDNIDGRVMSQIMHIDEIVDNGDFVPTLLGFRSQADVAMYQQGLAVAHMEVRRLQTQLEEGDWVPEPGLLPELAEPMPAATLRAQVDAMLTYPLSGPQDIAYFRATAEAMALGNAHWAPLAETARRSLAYQLNQRANYMEFDPVDFAQRLMHEEGPEHYDDAITLLENNDYDHPTLRGLPAVERARAAQVTAIEMRRLAFGVPPAPELAAPMPALALAAPMPAAARQLPALSNEDEDVANGILDILEDVDMGFLRDNASATDYTLLANSFENDPEQVLGMGEAMLEDAEDRAAVVRYIAQFLRQRARDTGQPRAVARAIEPAPALAAPMPAATQISPARLDTLYDNYVRDYQRLLDNGEITERWQPEDLADFIRGDDDIGTHNPTQAERDALAQLVVTRRFSGSVARAVEPAAEIRMPALTYEDEDVANNILDILENPDYGFLPHDASATEYTLLANSFENDPADILGMGYPPYEEALENAAVVRYIAQFLRRRARAPEPRAVDQAIEPAVDLSDEDEGVAMSILDAFHQVELGLLDDNPTSTEFRSLAARFRQNPEDVLGIHAEMLDDAQDRAGVVRYVADFFRQRARDTRGRAPRGYQKGGIVQQDPTTDQMRYELMMRRH